MEVQLLGAPPDAYEARMVRFARLLNRARIQ